MRRYVLGNVQSEDIFINGMGFIRRKYNNVNKNIWIYFIYVWGDRICSGVMHNRRHRLISPIRRNVVGRLCIRPTIVFLILSNQKARVRSLTSRRPFLCTYNMYQHQQRFANKIYKQNPNTIDIFIFAINAYVICNGGYTIDVNDSFLLFVEMSSDVFV